MQLVIPNYDLCDGYMFIMDLLIISLRTVNNKRCGCDISSRRIIILINI